MSKLYPLSVKRKIETTFSDRELYKLFDELSFLYEDETISFNDLKAIKKTLFEKLNKISVLKRQLDSIVQV